MKFKKYVTIVGLAGGLLFGNCGINVIQVEANSYTDLTIIQEERSSGLIIPMRSGLLWRFKTVNGQRYRRLYDTDKEIWLTPWIPC